MALSLLTPISATCYTSQLLSTLAEALQLVITYSAFYKNPDGTLGSYEMISGGRKLASVSRMSIFHTTISAICSHYLFRYMR